MMKRKLKARGGSGRGQGRSYNPEPRIWLANRYEKLKWEFRNANAFKPGYEALFALHAELRGKGKVDSTKRLITTGRHEELFLDELATKRHNGEPLSDFEQSILRKLSARWRSRHRNEPELRHVACHQLNPRKAR